jgi:hypothetical protein
MTMISDIFTHPGVLGAESRSGMCVSSLSFREREVYDAEVRDQAGNASERLLAVLEAYALISHESHGHHDTELAAFLHQDQHVARARRQVRNLIRDLLVEAAGTGSVRDDVAPDELAIYCVHALRAASSLPSKAAVRRLITVTLAGLRPTIDPV